ncbi:hypothetical protein NQD34_005528, partial [Periophthalmus magnuspinnatus]
MSISQSEGEEGQQQSVQDADDRQNIGPAHGTVPQSVLICPLTAHALYLLRIPAVRVDHAPHHHQHSCETGEHRGYKISQTIKNTCGF